MLFLLILLILIERQQRSFILYTFSNVFSIKERDSIFSPVTQNSFSQIVLFLYKVCCFSLAIYYIIFNSEIFSIIDFIKIIFIVLSFFAIKYILIRYISFVFMNNTTFTIIYYHYNQLVNFFSIILYPILLICLFTPQICRIVFTDIFILFVVFYFILWLIKAFRLFFTNLLAFLYILLYFCTLEILPLYTLFSLAEFIVNQKL